MKATRAIIHYSLFAALIGAMPYCADAAMRVGNNSRSYAQAYQQVNSMRNPVQTAQPQTQQMVVVTPSTDVENNLPVRVADEELAQEIATQPTDSAAYDRLTQCAMIYPNGEFAWDSPTIGSGVGGADTCVAVVELRGYQAGPNGEDLVLARANLAAGDRITCNIGSFPESTMITSAVESFTFPADRAPTMDDVLAQMNQEQKQNAGMKIVAGALIGGLGGNMSGANDPGNDSLLGTDRGKVQNTVIGALSGAALMAGNAYAGKVAGDTILSAGVNAAAGGVVGNMSASGDSVLRIERCEINGESTTCLWGALVTSTALPVSQTAYYNIDTGVTYVCDANGNNCNEQDLVSIRLTAFPDNTVDELERDQIIETINMDAGKQYFMAIENGKISIVSASDATSANSEYADNIDGLVTSTALPVSQTAYYNIDTGVTYVCDANGNNCNEQDLGSIRLTAFQDKTVDELERDQIIETIKMDAGKQYFMAIENGKISIVSANDATSANSEYADNIDGSRGIFAKIASAGTINIDGSRGIFAKIASAGTIDQQIPAMIQMTDKAFGMTSEDWREWKSANGAGQPIYGRSGNGVAYALSKPGDINNFYPMMQDATDGSLIDFGNKARLKSTLIGAGVGGALGGFAGYQGAQLDVQNRWVSAVREYEDSLTKVYCVTGDRYLSKYNDAVFIPAITTPTASDTEQ